MNIGNFCPPSVYFNREFPYVFGYCFSCRYLVELGPRQLGLPVLKIQYIQITSIHFSQGKKGKEGGWAGWIHGIETANSNIKYFSAQKIHAMTYRDSQDFWADT